MPIFVRENVRENSGAKSVREIYEKCGDTGAKYSVPVLYDKKLKTIVRYVHTAHFLISNISYNIYAS